ncbi:MAG: SurA N-terminal domain-containing protein [SAR86 cluster bacterium]|nr:SurA N-terminal domain-containing protein [SAR86 cluster bacterium]
MAVIQSIRNNLTGTAAKIVVGIIAVTFALFFGGNYVLFDNDANVIASVNSKKIDVFDLDLEMARVQSILRQRFDDPDFSIEEEALRSLALNSLISDALILDFLEQNKVEVLDLSAYKLLAKNEIFQEEGNFSLGKVNTFARQNGFLPGKYVQSISEDIALNFWRVGLGASSFLTSSELNQNIKLANQTRDITFTKINKKDIEEKIKVSEEEILKFYTQNPSYFRSEEKAKLRFINISLEDLKENQLIQEEEIKREYQAYLDSFDLVARRSASHLMINISSERTKDQALDLANQIKKKIDSGDDFTSLVEEYSEDEGTKNTGGSLGISDGSAFPEEFEIALEQLKEGQVSNPIALEESVHLVKLTNFQAPIPDEYESRKEEIKQNLIEQAASAEYVDSLELAAELTFTNDSLDSLSQELNLEIKTKDFFSRAEAEKPFKDTELLNLIFNDLSIKEGNLSELIEIDNQYGVIFELEDFQEEKTKDFESVKNQAQDLLTNKLTEEKIEGLKAKLLAGLEAGSSLEVIAKENQLKVDSYKSINRDSSLFTRNVLLEIFNEPKSSIGKSYSYASMLNGDEIVFRLDKVTQLNTEVSDEEKDSLKNFFLEDRAETELVTLQTSMQESSSVTVN